MINKGDTHFEIIDNVVSLRNEETSEEVRLDIAKARCLVPAKLYLVKASGFPICQ